MSSSVTFDLEFESEVLAQCLRDTDYLKRASGLLERRSFLSEHHGWVWSVIKDVWEKFGERPTPKVFVARAEADFHGDEDEERRAEHLRAVSRLYKLRVETPKATLDQLRRFTLASALEETLESALKHAEKGKWEDALGEIRALARRDFRPTVYKSIDWIEGFEERQRERKRRRDHPEDFKVIPTGIKRLDRILSGGHGAGEVGLVVGTTGRGKSIFLNHLGYHAAARGFGVLHVPLEMPAEQIAARYDSRWSGYAYAKFKTFDFSADELRALTKKLEAAKRRFGKKIRIVSYPIRSCDINMLRELIEETRSYMKVDVLLVDSADHMNSTLRTPDYRLQQADIYWMIKGLAEEMQVAVWSSTQAGREWEGRTAGAEAVSESYDKARIADLVLTLNAPASRTRTTPIVDDDDEEDGPGSRRREVEEDVASDPKPELELFVAKYRDGVSKIRIPLDSDFSRMLIREAEKEGGGVEDFGED